MGDVDRLSRQQILHNLQPAQRVEFRNRPALEALFALIDPATPHGRTAHDHHAAFVAIYHHVSPLLTTP